VLDAVSVSRITLLFPRSRLCRRELGKASKSVSPPNAVGRRHRDALFAEESVQKDGWRRTACSGIVVTMPDIMEVDLSCCSKLI